jgi:purine-binding chemotaxis protein CheW
MTNENLNEQSDITSLENLEDALAVDSMQENDVLSVGESTVRQFVTFYAGGETFAVDMAPVQEIIRVPNVVHVPLVPDTLEGLANLRGKILPIISLRRIFGFPEQENDDATRAIVIDLGQPLGFVVDRVCSVVEVDLNKIEGIGSISGVVNTDLLTGLLKDVGGVAMTMILDFDRLIESEFSDIAKVSASATISATHTLSELSDKQIIDNETLSDELQLVSFSVAEQEYAMSISDVQEIVQVPEQIIHVPHSDSHVLGMMTLRQRMLPLVSLRQMFGLPRQDEDERSRIVVISVGNAAVGVVMDRANEVLRVSKNDVSAMPSMLARDGALSDINEICCLNNGKRLVSIISAENMFHHHAVQEALSSIEMTQDEDMENNERAMIEDDEQMVVFRLGSEEFGVPIESVQEIVRVPEELTHVPKAPTFIEGVINLRGSVLPVVDQRRRLGLPTLERCEQQRIMVFLFDGVRTGFIVDSVSEVLKVPRSAIEPAPHLSVDQVHLISRVANLEKQKRLILLMDPSHLLESKDVKGLSLLTG